MNGPDRPRIEPVPPGTPRPKWSVMIPTYQCAHYLPETLESVLAQDPGAEWMQIEVVDDDSSDNPAEVVRAYGDRVGFYKQPHNRGHVENMNTCLMRSRGELVHLLHGDDAVRPGFYSAIQQAFERPTVGAAFCRYIAMDEAGRWTAVARLQAEEDGILENWLDEIAVGQLVQPPTMVVRRSVYERLGGFDSRIARYGEDWEMWTRIAAHYRVAHVTEPLALYRISTGSLSGEALKTGQNVRDLRQVIALNREVLPPERVDELTRRALEGTALTAIRRARRLHAAGDFAAARAQVREALRTNRSPAVLERTAVFGAVVARRGLLRAFGRRV